MPTHKTANQTDDFEDNIRCEEDELALSQEVCSIWLGMRDSNPRMHGPKPCALPLGQSPILINGACACSANP